MEKTRRDGKRKNRDKYFFLFFFSVGNRTMKKEKGSINRFTVKWKTHRERKSNFHSEMEQRKRIYNRLEFSLINRYKNNQSL